MKLFIAICGLVSLIQGKNIVDLGDFQDYLVGGQAALVADFPHAVSLRNKGNHMCGGSLISRTHILTAAHCLLPYLKNQQKIEDLTVVTGSNSLNSQAGKSYEVESVHSHETFSPSAYADDIGILKLKEPVELSADVQLVSLPSGPEVPEGASLTVSGFGVFEQGNPVSDHHNLSPFLRKLDIHTISKEQCQKLWDDKRWFYGIKINNGHLCSSTSLGTGYCNGDSGSGVLYNGQIVGVVSFGDRKCAVGLPDVATRVGYYLDFIRRNL